MKRILPFALSVLAVGALAASPSFAANSPVFHSPTNGSNYIAYDMMKTAPDAKAYCSAKGGHLAVINNHNEAVELFSQLSLLIPSSGLTGIDSELYYTIGTYVAAATTTQKTVTNQGVFTDGAYSYSGFDGTAPATEIYLQMSPYYSDFKFDNLTTQTRRFVCEFEDSPI